MPTLPRWRRLLRQEDGVSTVLLAVLALPMVGVIGLAVDAANLYMVHSRLSYAADAAALAGGRVYFSSTRDSDVKSYFSANFPQGAFGATVGTPVVSESANRKDLTVTASATVPTLFMQIFGVQTVNVSASSTVERQGGLEVALVLDVTGSMGNGAGSKLASMQAGAKTLLDTIYDPTLPTDAVYAAIVPFRTAVNVGSSRTSWVVSGYNWSNFSTEGWKGCLEQRSISATGSDGLPLDISDQVPSSDAYKFKPYLYENTAKMGPSKNGQASVTPFIGWGGKITAKFDNNWPASLAGNKYGTNDAAVGPNLNCPETPVTPLSPVSSKLAALKSSIDSFTTIDRGGTEIVLGLVWGWHVLSDAWQSYWGTSIDASQNRAKVLVLLTDGDNQVVDWVASSGGTYVGLPGWPAADSDPYGKNSDYTAYGRLRTLKSDGTVAGTGPLGATSLTDMLNKLTARQLAACDAIKKQNITIYTIGYEAPSSAVPGLQACASDPSMYFAANQTTIQQTFRDLGKKLSELRIVK